MRIGLAHLRQKVVFLVSKGKKRPSAKNWLFDFFVLGFDEYGLADIRFFW